MSALYAFDIVLLQVVHRVMTVCDLERRRNRVRDTTFVHLLIG
jgi:hypothetical protein